MPYLVIVQRGRTRVYEALKDEFERPDPAAGIHVLWDRRSQQRRARPGRVHSERRRGERRRTAPSTWPTLGMLLVAVPGNVGIAGVERAGAPMDPQTVPCNHPSRPCRLSATLRRRLVKDGETWFHYVCPAGHRFHQRIVRDVIEVRGCECRVSD